MGSAEIVSELSAMAERADGREKDVLKHAIALLEQYGLQLKDFKWMASQRYRSSSEKIAPGQIAMAFIEHLLSQANESKPEEKKEEKKKPPRDKRKSKITALPVKVVNKELPEEQRRCECGTCKESMGFDASKRIVYEPSKLFVLEERLWKYKCRPCGDGIVKAPATPKLVDGSMASSSLLAHLTVSKVVDCIPLERVGKQLSRHKADIASSTLCDWFAQGGREVMALLPHIRRDLLTSMLISLDDTPLPTKNLAHVNNIQRGRLWLYIGDVDRIAYCSFSEDWKGKHPRAILEDFRGDIQGDGYGGISALFSGADPPNRFGCNDHARRKFHEAFKLGDTRAEEIVGLFGQVYAVEREASTRNFTAEQKLALRQEKSLPLWQELERRIDAITADVAPKGPLGKAVTYWRKQQQTLRAFLANGHVPISNAHVERLLRTVALMRKNALFIGSLDAGPRYAALLTMALNCALCGANPFDYFTWLFDQLAAGVQAKNALSVMPQAWVGSQQDAQQSIA
jgi:transposase